MQHNGITIYVRRGTGTIWCRMATVCSPGTAPTSSSSAVTSTAFRCRATTAPPSTTTYRDSGYQSVKVNSVNDGSDDGLLTCSPLEYITTSPGDCTNSLGTHNAHSWTVRDNGWYRIRTPNNAPVPIILFWSGASDTVVKRNILVGCYQGISFDSASHGPGGHTGGVVRNNFIYAAQPHDVAIERITLPAG